MPYDHEYLSVTSPLYVLILDIFGSISFFGCYYCCCFYYSGYFYCYWLYFYSSFLLS